jgi:hypothetical protein
MSQNNRGTFVSELFGEDEKSSCRRYVKWWLLIFDGSLSIRPLSVFPDSHSVTSLSDCRLKVLKDSFHWFQDWKKEMVQLKAAGVNTAQMLISPKYLEDMDNMLHV